MEQQRKENKEKEERQRGEMERQLDELKNEKNGLREDSLTYSIKRRARYRILGAHPAGQICMSRHAQ